MAFGKEFAKTAGTSLRFASQPTPHPVPPSVRPGERRLRGVRARDLLAAPVCGVIDARAGARRPGALLLGAVHPAGHAVAADGRVLAVQSQALPIACK